jgi:D-arabinose 1-dehydrogenase-like Zn-dependent alcohol dehydrogenase
MSATVDGLVRRGELIVVGATPDMVEASGYQMIGAMKKDLRSRLRHRDRARADTARRRTERGAPLDQEVVLEHAEAAFAKMLSGAARFRMVLTTGN